MLSYLGFEAYDPPICIKFQRLFDIVRCTRLYDGYAYGASIDYVTDSFSIGVGQTSQTKPGLSTLLLLLVVENFTAKIWSDFR